MRLLSTTLKGLLVLSLFGQLSIKAQNSNQLLLKSGNYPLENQYEKVAAGELANGNYYRVIQFENIPSTSQKEELNNKGIELLNYIPKNSYYARINANVDLDLLKNYAVTAVVKIQESFKLSESLSNKKYEDWALNGSKIKLNAMIFEGVSENDARKNLNTIGAEVIIVHGNNVAQVEIEIAQLPQLYKQPIFYYFEQIDPPSKPENLVGVTDHRSNSLATSYSSGLKYDGTGITVMMQDNSRLDEHIDYTGRFTDVNATQSGDHGEHCGGTIAGAGNLDPTARGMAYGAELLVYDWNNNNYNDIPTLYANDNVTITSKSYSNGTNAGYTALAQQLDQQVRTMPSLVHVFSAGNSNGGGSSAAGTQWFNITGGHKAGKNVITCANLTNEDVVANSSSRGPCADGRIKPDISAVGTDVYSTHDPNDYVFKTGTSMSCPGVAGTLAQLYHGYKDINGGANPPSGLIKAAVLNTADDIGNPGPDFIHGWGRINARRAFDLISSNNYTSSTISQGGSNVHKVTVPAGTDQLRVMVLWVDYEGAVSSSPSLVNDINIDVVDPGVTTYNPWVLDPTPNATTLDLPAVRGVDDLNNMEQVTIDAPAAGVYDVNVSGFSIPQGPQTYYLVYEFVTDDVVLTYPIGGEGIDSDVDEKIRWDAYENSGTFDLEYSTDNGSNWNTIATGVNASQRFYDWNVPAVVTGEALVRVTRGASSSQSHEPFSIIRVPTGLTVNWVCPDSMEVAWNTVPNATGYEVSLLGNKYMDSVGTAIGGTTNSLIIAAQSNVDKWWSVKALGANNCEGRRAIAKYQASGVINCVLTVDATMQSATPGNEVISICSNPTVDVELTVENIGANPISNIPVYYSLNGATPVMGTVTGTLNTGQTANYTFVPALTLTTGTYTLKVWADYAGDGNSFNDTVTSIFNYNATLVTLPFVQDFESDGLCGTGSDCGATSCSLVNEWTNEQNGVVDGIDWRVNNGSTPSRVGITPNETGPTQDYNPGNAAGKYAYLEASNGCNLESAYLVSPCIDLTTAVNPSLSFAYHMYDLSNSMMGNLSVDVYNGGVWTNNIITTLVGDKGDQWNTLTTSLSAYI